MFVREFDLTRDYAVVLKLWQTAGPGVRVGKSDTQAEIAKKLTRDPDLFLVAEEDGQVVGTVLGGFDGRRGMVYHLAVEAGQRRQGVGTALLGELESRFKAKGCLKSYLMVTHDNQDVIAFYRRLGWEVMDIKFMGKEL